MTGAAAALEVEMEKGGRSPSPVETQPGKPLKEVD